jgi:hypothetical protein
LGFVPGAWWGKQGGGTLKTNLDIFGAFSGPLKKKKKKKI